MIKEEELKNNTVLEIAKLMAIAARTAPKGKGANNIRIIIAEKKDIEMISSKMIEIYKKTGIDIFNRDGENIKNAEAVLLIGTIINPLNLSNCGLCGFENCLEKSKFDNTPCAFNTGDLGIAIGSAVSVAKDLCVDNRIMYTIGKAVVELGFFKNDVKIIYGIPLSATSKNPFFDRK